MEARMPNPAAVLAGATTGIQHIYKAIYQGGVDQETLELVHLRASQINGCSACVDAGLASARKAAVAEDKRGAVVAWSEAPYFSDAQRAVLALTESATRLADRPDGVPDDVWEAAASHYDEKQLSALILMIGLTNMFNRLNRSVREPAGTRWG